MLWNQNILLLLLTKSAKRFSLKSIFLCTYIVEVFFPIDNPFYRTQLYTSLHMRSPAKALNASHFSVHVLTCFRFSEGNLNVSFSKWLRKTSRSRWPFGSFRVDLGEKAGILLNWSRGSFLKNHFVRISPQKFERSCLSSGSFIFL